MSDTFYFFYQTEAKSKWTLALASERDHINREVKPELCTVLDVNNSFEDELTAEEKDKIKYRGTMFFDFDSEDLEEVIPAFQEFLTNLRAKGVNLNALKLYCSGGKGFHVEMPSAMLMAKVPPAGIASLPLIYKEVAHALYVNTLDLRVYSRGHGRQWRNPNIKRANGKHKVQITADEALEMTAERYEELVLHPRPLFPAEPPAFVADIALIYSKARDKVEHGLRNRKKKKSGNEDLKRFKGEWPETLRSILAGEGLKEKVGWNYICVQLAITADALGKTEQQLMEDAEGLIQTYAGDSSRYGTPQKRRAELRKQHQYHAENPCYDYSIGGVLSLVQKEVAAKSDLTLGEYVPDGSEEEEEGAEGEEDEATTIRVRVNSNGMFSKTEFGWKNISHLGFSDPVLLMKPSGEHVGYDVDVLVNGKRKGRNLINIKALATKANLHNYAMEFNASFRGTDMDAAHIIDLMRDRVESKARISYVTQVEGIDLIRPPDAEHDLDLDLIWASPSEVISPPGSHTYTFRPLAAQNGTYKSDLYKSEGLTNCEEDRQMLNDLFSFNTPRNLARILGWFGASFVCPILRHFYGAFPLLQIYGGASAGKSKTIALLAHMHYHLHKPKIVQSSGMTQWPLLVAASSTASIPLILEELRARFLKSGGKYEMVVNLLKSNYDGHSMERGALGDKGAGPVVNEFANTAPMAFIAEEAIGEVAVQERCIAICMSQGDRQGRDNQYARLKAKAPRLGRLGKSLVTRTLAIDLPQFIDKFDEMHERVRVSMGDSKTNKDRPIYNLAVTMMGLYHIQSVVRDVFGSEFDDQFDIMNEVVLENVAEFVPQNMSEAARVLDTMAQLTKVLDIQYKLEHGRDYTVNPGSGTLDIKMKPAYSKYLRYTRSLGATPLYDSDQAFIASMSRYEGVVQLACPDNQTLFDNPFEVIYRFSIKHLENDRVEPFKC